MHRIKSDFNIFVKNVKKSLFFIKKFFSARKN